MKNFFRSLFDNSCVEATQLDELNARSRLTLGVNWAVSLLLTLLLAGHGAASGLLYPWLALVWGVTAIRWRHMKLYRVDAQKRSRLDYWKKVMVRGALASGLLWALAAWLLPLSSPHLYQVLVLCVLIGMMAGSAVSWSVFFPAFAAFFAPIGVSVFFRLGWHLAEHAQERVLYIGLLPLFAIFALAMFSFARSSARSFCQLIVETERSVSGARYKAMFDAAQLPMLLIDPEAGRIVDANQVACEFYGHPIGRLSSMTVGDLNAEALAEVFPRIGNQVEHRQLQQHTSSGGLRDVEVHSGPVRIGEELLLFYVVQDVTLRNELEQKLKRGKLLLHTMLDNLPFMAWLKDAEGHYLSVNRLHAEATGLGHPANVIGKTDAELWPQDQAEKYRIEDLNVMVSRSRSEKEETGLSSRRERWYRTVKVPVVDRNGELVGTTGYAEDITERKRAEESMRLAASIYQSSAEAIMVTDELNRIIDVNPAFTLITGYTLEEVEGKDPKLLRSGRHDAEFYRQMWHDLLAYGHWQGELWDRRKDGGLYAKWVTITVIRRDNGQVFRYVAQFSDITERKKKEEQLWQHANFDTLTGLPNRRLFRDRLEQEIKKVNRATKQLALLFIDLDRFKQVNDTLGHEMGDLLLVEASRRIVSCVRESDTVARLGGDEFTVILPEFGDRTKLERIAQQIINQLNQPFLLGKENAYISASIGITLYSDAAPDADHMLRHADQAMYVAKSEGRSRFGYFVDSMQQDAREKFDLTNDLRQALARQELTIFFQPIVDMESGAIIKAESLLRWRHPVRGMVSPGVFIPLAEESGLIVEIGEWVFREVIAQVSRWKEKYGRIIPVSVNKSPLQFLDKARGMSWPELLEAHGLPGNSVVVEITEGVLLKETDVVKRQLLDLRNHMMEVSIDDFGTGYSALSYLKRFSIDYLKIDRSFISSLTEDQNSRELTEGIIAMAHKLGIKAIAEGVETEEQRDLLRSYRCDLAQGFLYSRPVPLAAFEALLEGNITSPYQAGSDWEI